jgi:phosphoserine phosphatase
MKVLYLDFCHTIVSRFTLGWYIRFLLLKRFRLVEAVLFRLGLCSLEYAALKATRGLSSEDRLKHAGAFAKKLQPFIKHEALKIVREYQAKDFQIVWVSAGLSDYIKIFAEHFEIQGTSYICSEVQERHFQKMYGIEKIHAINKFESAQAIVANCAMSDHISDLPMLEHCDEAIVVMGPNRKLVEVGEKREWRIVGC